MSWIGIGVVAMVVGAAGAFAQVEAAKPAQEGKQREGKPAGDRLDLPTVLNRYIESVRKGERAAFMGLDVIRSAMKVHGGKAASRKLVLERAGELAKSGEEWWKDPGYELVSMVRPYMTEEDVAVIREVFPKLNANARVAALACLTEVETEASAKAYLELARSAAKAGELVALPIGDFDESVTALSVLIPGILDLVEGDGPASFQVYQLFLKLLNEDQLKDETKAKLLATASESIVRVVAKVKELEKTEPKTAAERDVRDEMAGLAGIVLDVLSYGDAAGVEKAARPALEVKSTYVRLWASAVLLEAGKEVPEAVKESVAGDVVHRARFARVLRQRGVGSEFPQKYANNADHAAGQMMEWLMHPTELGEAPEAFELGKRVERTVDGRAVEYFVYKFRRKAEKEGEKVEWEMGVCGPFTVGRFDTRGGGDTFSRFNAWDEAGAEKEVDEVVALIAEMNKRHAEGGNR